jgi:hypothetical protein
MVNGDHITRAAGITTAALAVILLGACTAPGATVPGDYPDVTLAETKSFAQLLRNEAANRLPVDVIDQIIESEDTSVTCLSEKDDPTGIVRSWHSTADVLIVDNGAVDVQALVNQLTASFEEQGWTARSLGGNSSVTSKLIESETSLADIQVAGYKPNDTLPSTGLEQKIEQYTIRIQVHGPCVRTDGTDSDEVKILEKAK